MEVNTGHEATKLARDYYADHSTTRYDLLRTGMHPFSVDRGDGGTEGDNGEYANGIACSYRTESTRPQTDHR